jgi:hypothetical protein
MCVQIEPHALNGTVHAKEVKRAIVLDGGAVCVIAWAATCGHQVAEHSPDVVRHQRRDGIADLAILSRE